MKNTILLTLAIMGFVSQAFSSEWSSQTYVKDIYAGYKDGFVLFTTTDTHHNPNNCTDSHYSLDPQSADVQSALAILLAAQRSNSPISIGLDISSCARSGVTHLSGKIVVTRLRSM